MMERFKLGDTATYTQTITDADIKSFAGISGDNNPVHMSDEYAEGSRFKKRIAHGLISASFFSALFGTKLPGPGCVYVNQSLKFLRPVYINDTVTARVVLTDIDVVKEDSFLIRFVKLTEKKLSRGRLKFTCQNKAL